MSTHAKIMSPSAAHRRIPCPASAALEAGIADHGSPHAAEGTAAHFLASECLTHHCEADIHEHRMIAVPDHGDAFWFDGKNPPYGNVGLFPVDAEMCEHVQRYLDFVRSIPGDLMVEVALPLEPITEEEGAVGTADAVVLAKDEIVVIDLKYGRGVRVDAAENRQLGLYGAAALAEYDLMGAYERVRLVVAQPRLDHLDEWVTDKTWLEELSADARNSVLNARQCIEAHGNSITLDRQFFGPSESACRWCKAKADCPALRDQVLQTAAGDFVELDQEIAPQMRPAPDGATDHRLLGNLMRAVPLIEQFCDAVKERTREALVQSNNSPTTIEALGFKLVQGRRGARSWVDAEEAEETLKSMRLKKEEMYDFKLISPTSAEKLLKESPRRWTKLEKLIVRPDGKPTLVGAEDKKAALEMGASADDFEDIPETNLVADLI